MFQLVMPAVQAALPHAARGAAYFAKNVGVYGAIFYGVDRLMDIAKPKPAFKDEPKARIVHEAKIVKDSLLDTAYILGVPLALQAAAVAVAPVAPPVAVALNLASAAWSIGQIVVLCNGLVNAVKYEERHGEMLQAKNARDLFKVFKVMRKDNRAVNKAVKVELKAAKKAEKDAVKSVKKAQRDADVAEVVNAAQAIRNLGKVVRDAVKDVPVVVEAEKVVVVDIVADAHEVVTPDEIVTGDNVTEGSNVVWDGAADEDEALLDAKVKGLIEALDVRKVRRNPEQVGRQLADAMPNDIRSLANGQVELRAWRKRAGGLSNTASMQMQQAFDSRKNERHQALLAEQVVAAAS